MTPTIRSARPDDWDAIWPVIEPVIRRGDTYVLDPATTEAEARRYWLAPGNSTYVAETAGRVVGTYILRANQPAQGAHVANCGYMVAGDAAGQGIGRAMCAHSLDEARRAGFEAMQFNFVVSTNENAVHLWQSMGFAIVGTLPRAFRHPLLGNVDAYVMHRFL